MLWRHGDIIIASAEAIPAKAKRQANVTLALGEKTGHSHRIEDARTAEVWEHKGERFVRVLADAARLIHEEHQPITLPRGVYKFWFQREYTPQAIRRVID